MILCNLTITCLQLISSKQDKLRIIFSPYNFGIIRKFKVFLYVLYFTGGLSNILHFRPDGHLCNRTFALLASHGTVIHFHDLLFKFTLNENYCVLTFLKRVTSMILMCHPLMIHVSFM